jgi:predicted XRE-type DNA-binding protein
MKNLKNQKQYGHPFSEEETERILKRITQPGYRRINKLLSPNASELDKVKHRLCKSIGSYCDDNQLSEKELANKLGIDIPKTEYILFCHLDELSLEELIDCVAKLTGHLEVKVSYGYQTTA